MLADSVEKLRTRGEFLEYRETEAPPPAEPGIVTVGEQTEEGRIRLYRLAPEEFQEVYAKRGERRAAAEEGLRRFREILSADG